MSNLDIKNRLTTPCWMQINSRQFPIRVYRQYGIVILSTSGFRFHFSWTQEFDLFFCMSRVGRVRSCFGWYCFLTSLSFLLPLGSWENTEFGPMQVGPYHFLDVKTSSLGPWDNFFWGGVTSSLGVFWGNGMCPVWELETVDCFTTKDFFWCAVCLIGFSKNTLSFYKEHEDATIWIRSQPKAAGVFSELYVPRLLSIFLICLTPLVIFRLLVSEWKKFNR